MLNLNSCKLNASAAVIDCIAILNSRVQTNENGPQVNKDCSSCGVIDEREYSTAAPYCNTLFAAIRKADEPLKVKDLLSLPVSARTLVFSLASLLNHLHNRRMHGKLQPFCVDLSSEVAWDILAVAAQYWPCWCNSS